jgi:hypothetical protein
MTMQEDQIMDGLQFVKVMITQDIETHSGYLTTISCQLLLIELRRRGFRIVGADAELTGSKE